jgi:hypothetical protein
MTGIENGWAAFFMDDGRRIVFPVNDLRAHDLDRECWCQPFDDDGITVHNSMDLRETYERGRKVS